MRPIGHCGELTQKHTANPVHNHFLFEGAVCQGFSEVREKITDLRFLDRKGEKTLAADARGTVASERQKVYSKSHSPPLFFFEDAVCQRLSEVREKITDLKNPR